MKSPIHNGGTMEQREQLNDLVYFLRLAEHKLDQRLQGQYTNEQILGMLLKLARELLLKHKIPALDHIEGKAELSIQEVSDESFTETCEKCGSPNFVWFIDSLLWNEVMRNPYLESIVCPTCFILHREQKLGKSGVWKLVMEFDTPRMERGEKSATANGGNQ